MSSSFQFPIRVLGLLGALTVSVWAAGSLARAEQLAEAECKKLDTERRALMVLGIDKHFEKGVEWVKTNLTVADLDLVRRYVEVYEQLKFRCQEDIGIIEVEEPDTVDDDGAQTVKAGTPAPGRKGGAEPQPGAQAQQPGIQAQPGGSGKTNALAQPGVSKQSSVSAKSDAAAKSDATVRPGTTIQAGTAAHSQAKSAPVAQDTTQSIRKSVDANTTSIAKRRQTPPAQ